MLRLRSIAIQLDRIIYSSAFLSPKRRKCYPFLDRWKRNFEFFSFLFSINFLLVFTRIYIYMYIHEASKHTKVTEKKEEEEKFWNDVEGRVGRRGWEGGRSVDLASFRKILGVVGKIAGRSTGWNIVNNYLVRQVVMRMLIRRRYVRRVARMIVGVRSGMVLMLGLRRERLGRRGRCPRPVVRPVAFIGAIHLQGRISSTRPEESLPPSTHGDTKDSDTDMATLIPGRIRDTLDSDSLSATSCCVPRSPAFEMLRDPWRSDVATRRPPFILYSPPIFSRQTLPLPPPSDSSYLLRREEGRQEGRRDSFSPIFIIRYLFIIIRRNKRRTATFLFFFFFFEREHDHAFVA